MAAKYWNWTGLLFAIAVGLATLGAARADQQYYVTYVELLPSGVEAGSIGARPRSTTPRPVGGRRP